MHLAKPLERAGGFAAAVRLCLAIPGITQAMHPPAFEPIPEPQDEIMIPFGFLEPAESWEPSRVTIVGDAAHGMLPTLGMGANLSLNDAALLIDQLDRVGRGEVDIPEALGAYEAQMREIAYPILRMTLQHDENFGGGGLKDAGTGAVGL